MSKSLYESSRTFVEAWHNFVIAYCYMLKIPKLMDLLAKKINKILT